MCFIYVQQQTEFRVQYNLMNKKEFIPLLKVMERKTFAKVEFSSKKTYAVTNVQVPAWDVSS